MTHNSQSSLTTPVLEGTQTQLLRLPGWRLWVPLLLQTGLILAAPAQPFYTQVTGKTVVLQTAPVDPYDFLRGYSQTLNYDISRTENLRSLPGWKDLRGQQAGEKSSDYLDAGTRFYLILEAPASAESSPPKAWKPVRVSRDRPTNLPTNQIGLKGKSTGNSIEYGLETYYMPESRTDEINQDISQARLGRQSQSVVVEVKVDAQGRSVPISFWVSERNYRF